MRDYIKPENLLLTLVVATILTMMSMPRIAGMGFPVRIYLPATFIAMFLVSGAAVAWSTSAGMSGIYPSPARQLIGVCMAIAITALAAAVSHAWLDPVLRSYLTHTGGKDIQDQIFPSTMESRIGLVLWSAGFENMFCHAAPVCFLGRLSQNKWLSIVLTAAFRFSIVSMKLANTGVAPVIPLFAALSGLGAFMCAAMFAYAGLLPSMVLAAGLTLHVFF